MIHILVSYMGYYGISKMLTTDVQKCPFLRVSVVLWLHMGCRAQRLQQNPRAGRVGHLSGLLQHLSSCLPHATHLGLGT